MRLYAFLNYYLSPLQHGLQTAHCVSEMSVLLSGKELEVYETWAKHHKTIIILNGGNSAQLDATYQRLVELTKGLNIPLVYFNEDEQSLNGALTSVACILPEHFYDAEFVVNANTRYYQYIDLGQVTTAVYAEDSPIYELLSLVKSHRLA